MGSNHFVNFFQYNTPRDRNSLAISLIEKKRGEKKRKRERESSRDLLDANLLDDDRGFIWFYLVPARQPHRYAISTDT